MKIQSEIDERAPGGLWKFAPVALVLSGVLLDIIVRRQFFFNTVVTDLWVYPVSVLFEISAWIIVLGFAARRPLFGFGFLSLYLFSFLACYTFYIYFKSIPGINTFAYMFLVPEDFFGIAADGSNPWLILAALMVFSGVVAAARKVRNKIVWPSKRIVVYATAVLLVSGVALDRGISLKDNRALPFSNSLFSIIHGYWNFRGGEKVSYNLTRRMVHLDPPDSTALPPANILLIVNESLNASYFKEYGGGWNTTPEISAFLERNRGDVFMFPRAFCNSTVTKVSVSNFLAGRNPIEGMWNLEHSPLLYEVLKNADPSLRTALITSWSYSPANFDDFVSSPYLDYLRCQENMGAKKVCNVSADDSLITPRFDEFLDTVSPGGRFCAVLHYGNTHYPYFSKRGDRTILTGDRLLNDYLAALGNLDRNISSVLSLLESRSLLDNTVVLFTSDHGEAFGEVEKRWGHLGLFTLYTTRVPFWVYIPRTIYAAHPEYRDTLENNRAKNVTNNDIFPTVLALAGVPDNGDPKFGRSLLSSIDPRREIFIFNGLKENRTDNHEYIGVVKGDRLFSEETEGGRARYCVFDIAENVQSNDRWGRSPGEDAAFLSSLEDNGLDMFLLRPIDKQFTLIAFLDTRHLSGLLRTKQMFGR